MIPGSNVLAQALSLIARQTVTYFQYLSRTPNAIGQDVTAYAAPVSLTGSFQPVDRKLYQMYGLDLQRTYYNFYVTANLLDVNRDVSGDQLIFNGKRFQCESAINWYALDGWVGVLCVEIN